MHPSLSITSVARELRDAAHHADARRAARTVVGDQAHQMRQTLIALCKGESLSEHGSPGEASLYVIEGDVELHSGVHTARLGAGDLIEIPPQRHSVHAVSDAVVLLTAVPREFETSVGHPGGDH